MDISVMCPDCGNREVITDVKSEVVPYSTPTLFRMVVAIPVRTCKECKSSWTDAAAEDVRERAMITALATLKIPAPQYKEAVSTMVAMACEAASGHLVFVGEDLDSLERLIYRSSDGEKPVITAVEAVVLTDRVEVLAGREDPATFSWTQDMKDMRK